MPKAFRQRNFCKSSLGYISDYQAKFDGLRQSWESGKKSEEQASNLYRKAAPSAAAPAPRTYYDGYFVKEVCQLVEILVGAGHTAEAERVRDQAVACLDDSRLKSAVEDARKKTRS